MNAAFILLTSAWMAGADPAPAAPPAAAPAPAPAVVATGSACGGCGSSCDAGADACCHHRKKLFSGLFHKHHHHACCEAAPTCCAPAPVCCAPAPKPVCCAPAPKPVCCAPAPVQTCCDPCHHTRHHILHRHHHGDCCGGGCDACGAGAPLPAAPVPAPGGEPKKMPTTIGGIPAPVAPAKIGGEEGTRNPFDLARRYEGKAFASPDYSKLTGQLFFVHTDGGRWVLRYAPISKEDRYGGSVVFTRDINMGAFNEGDLISVEGVVLADKSIPTLGGALYRPGKLNIVERSQGLTAE